MSKEINRIHWKCRRGMREIDLLLREFSRNSLEKLNNDDLLLLLGEKGGCKNEQVTFNRSINHNSDLIGLGAGFSLLAQLCPSSVLQNFILTLLGQSQRPTR